MGPVRQNPIHIVTNTLQLYWVYLSEFGSRYNTQYNKALLTTLSSQVRNSNKCNLISLTIILCDVLVRTTAFIDA